MRIAIFSDVHGNLSALEAVLEHIDRQPDIDQIVFAGDLCLFGPRPQACIELIRQRSIRTIVGNTDEWVTNPPAIPGQVDDAQQKRLQHVRSWSQWVGEKLEQDSLTWIHQLCQSFQVNISPSSDPRDDLLIVHANPKDLIQIIFPPPNQQMTLYGRIRQSGPELEPLIQGTAARTIAFGHIHIPNFRIWREKVLINVSSVNLPGDGDPRAKYAVLTWRENEGWSAVHHRVKYAIEDEILAFRQNRPPSWKVMVDHLETEGLIPQIV